MQYPIETWPLWMEGPDGLLAKSQDRSLGNEPESLALHTWLVLSRLADQARLRSWLPEQVDEPRLWHRMYWACFLHDFGKAAGGFQNMLRGGERWPQRHEVLSLAFLDWLFPPGHTDRQWVACAIATHHRDVAGARGIRELYLASTDTAQVALQSLPSELDETVIGWLWDWIAQCGIPWADALGLSNFIEAPELSGHHDALASVNAATIKSALQEVVSIARRLEENEDYQFSAADRAGVFYRGLILSADHSASAHSPAFRPLTLSHEQARGGLAEAVLRDHQQAVTRLQAGSAILEAPTGSGKTEAALLWAAAQHAQQPAARLFYALPYQASMNAMRLRLIDNKRHGLPGDEVSLQHGRALQSLYAQLMDGADNNQHNLIEQARNKHELARLGVPPIRVFSPYQMLKAAYSLKGFEAQLLDYQGGLFILDEIHAYEPKRLALIVELVGWLSQHFAARFLVMTATLSPPVRDVLEKALPGCYSVRASQQVYQASQRHIPHLLPVNLLQEGAISRVEADLRAGYSVLMTLNTVQRAMEAYDLLSAGLADWSPERIILVHGRFTARDRIEKERLIQHYTGTQSQTRQPVLVISTQVVEVSLDISLDTLYSDPAPLEALLQRFGRVNRQRPIERLKPVYVCREYEESNGRAFGIYDAALVEGALSILGTLDGQPIDEGQVGDLLAQIYSGEVLMAWEREYSEAAENFRYVLDDLRPFSTADKDLAQEFYKLFDGVEVLPLSLEAEYERLRHEKGYVEANGLLIPMNWGQYRSLERAGLGWPEEQNRQRLYLIQDSALPYSAELGLDIQRLRRAASEENTLLTEDY